MLNHVKGTRHNHLKVMITLNQIIVAKYLFSCLTTRQQDLEKLSL